MSDISTRQVGFANTEWTITALPLLAYLKLEGFAPAGIQWDRPQPASTRIGADGKAVVNSRPVLYSCTINLLPTSNSRIALDALINASTPKYGKALVDYAVVLNENNYTTGQKTVYTGGIIEEIDAGDTADLDNGQADKQYRITFTDRTILPL